jgi:hypothetical protein
LAVLHGAKGSVPTALITKDETVHVFGVMQDHGSYTDSHAERIARAQLVLPNIASRAEVKVSFATIARAHIMILDCNMWQWFWRLPLTEALDRFDRAVPPWLSQLVLRVKTKLETRASFSIESTLFLPNLPEPVTFNYKHNSKERLGLEKTPQRVLEVTKAVILLWLNFPNDHMAEAKAQFVLHILERFHGAGILLLPSTWMTRSRLAALLMPKRTPNPGCFDWSRIAHSFSQHPLADSNSQESALLFQIQHKFAELDQAVLELEHSSLAVFLDPNGTRRMAKFVKFLQESLHCIIPGTGSPRTKLQSAILGNTDFLCPFRDFGHSRRCVLTHELNPYSPHRVRTRGGFFDALVFRCLTQAAPILTDDGLVHFDDHKDFLKQGSSRGEAYMCNLWAVSRQPNTHRKSENAQALWEASAIWSHYADQRSFMELWRLLQGPRFPGSGKLTAYLLAADYAYAGIVDMPTCDEMGKIIFMIKGGGRNGLRLLRLLSSDSASELQCISAFRCLHTYLSDCLSIEERVAMHFDVIMVEHALCKLTRLDAPHGLLL